MDEADLMRVRALMAEARASSANRHSDFMRDYADLVWEMCDFWRSVAPDGTELPDRVLEKVAEFRQKHPA